MNTLIDDTLTLLEQNCMRIREAPIDNEILAVSITHQIAEAKSELLKAILEKRVIAEVPNDQLEEMERIEAIPVSEIKALFGENKER